MTRGLDLNNPLNIRRNDIQWDGLAPNQPDPLYWAFNSPVWGIRAGARVLASYEALGISTVSGVINRWAPPTENDTASYILDVCQRSGLPPNGTIDIKASRPLLIPAMIWHEQGEQPYTDDVIAQGIALA